ncbi:MAG: hypothetical protein AB7U51_12420 [Arcobacter sp.]|uniref:hypothetical protein n=1 Tax=Arcobacter sp. TaxID=1872629 RepID=UPI003CFD453D
MSNYEEIKELSSLLFSKFSSLTLTTEQTAQATNRSVISLQRDRRNATGIPYTKLGANAGSDKALYSITDIARFIIKNRVKTA